MVDQASILIDQWIEGYFRRIEEEGYLGGHSEPMGTGVGGSTRRHTVKAVETRPSKGSKVPVLGRDGPLDAALDALRVESPRRWAALRLSCSDEWKAELELHLDDVAQVKRHLRQRGPF